MNDFFLGRNPRTLLPTTLTSEDGTEYPIDACFRTVLACIRMNADPDRPPLEKALFVARRFFLAHPPPDMWELFARFVSGESDASSDEEEPLMDFEQDSAAIYASFWQQYGVDLLHSEMHWVEFRALLAGLTEETCFGQRVRLRAMDDSKLSVSDRAKLRKLKDMIAITPKISRAERELMDELDARLAKGEDVSDLLQKLQEGG